MTDDVAKQPHYTQNHKGEPMDVESIDLVKSLGIFEEYCQGCIIKYVSRYRMKNGAEDLQKARVFIDWLIEEVGRGE